MSSPITDPQKFGVVNNKNSRRFAFELKNLTLYKPYLSALTIGPSSFFPFKLNPQEYSVMLPSRINATQTKGGVFIDDFGLGIGTISIRGFTLVFDHQEHSIIALDEFKKLRDEVYLRFFENRSAGQAPTTEMYFYNFTDEDYYQVVPYSFKFDRSSAKPHLYLYDIGLYILKAATQVSSSEHFSDNERQTYTFGATQMLGSP